MPGTGGLGPPPTDPNTTPATPAAGGPSLPDMCYRTPDGQQVKVSFSMPPLDPNQPTDTGQYCVSGGPRNGQCGTMTVDKASMTVQVCGNGVCTPSMPLSSKGPGKGYNEPLFGIPDSSRSVDCSTSTTASNTPTGGLGPPPDQKTGQPDRPRQSGQPGQPVGMPMGSLPAAPPQIITLGVPVPPVGGMPNTPNTPSTQSGCKPSSMGAHPCKPSVPCPPEKNTKPLDLKKKVASADPKTPVPVRPNDSPLSLKPNTGAMNSGAMNSGGTQLASAPSAVDSTPLCESKPPYLPWGGHGSATITVSGGKPCGIGWHDTGATILENITVSSQPAHGTVTPKSKNVVIFTPTPGYKGQDKFMLKMQERNGSRRAPASSA